MAQSSQYPLQIMENQTRFDLNAALENWRQELGAQPHISTDEGRELETHLRDSLAELKARGLNDEESFFLARRRIGQPQKLAEEFVKSDPAKAWRERVFWFAFGLLVFRFWNDLLFSFISPLHYRAVVYTAQNNWRTLLPEWTSFYLPKWLLSYFSAP